MGIEERHDVRSEKYVQSLVLNDTNIHKYIIDNLGLKYDGAEKFEKGSVVFRVNHGLGDGIRLANVFFPIFK